MPHVTVLGVSLVTQLEDTLLYAALPAHLDPTVDVMMMFRKPLAGIGQADPVVPDMSTEDDGEGVDTIAPDVAKLLPPAAPTLGRQHSVPYSAEERTALQAAARHVGGIPALSQVDPEVSFYKLPEWLLVQAAQDFGNSLNETPWYDPCALWLDCCGSRVDLTIHNTHTHTHTHAGIAFHSLATSVSTG